MWIESPCTLKDCNKNEQLDNNRESILNEYLGLVYCLLSMVSGLLAVELLDTDWECLEKTPETKCKCCSGAPGSSFCCDPPDFDVDGGEATEAMYFPAVSDRFGDLGDDTNIVQNPAYITSM
jgi:hypothetical protein